jgi:hypothetical protein
MATIIVLPCLTQFFLKTQTFDVIGVSAFAPQMRISGGSR